MSPADLALPGVVLDSLLAPISPQNPAGINLRLLPRSIYLEIEGLIEGKGVPDIVSVDENGRQFSVRDPHALTRSMSEGLKRALTCLSSESKDLEIAALAVQGLLAVHGYRGLWCGLYLLRELHEQYWDTVHPNPPAVFKTHDDFDDPLPTPVAEAVQLTERRILSARSGSVEKMEHMVRGALKLATLFLGDDGLPCRLADWDLAKTPDAERSTEKLNSLLVGQSDEDLDQLTNALDSCIDECRRLGQVFQHRYGRPAELELGLSGFEAPAMSSLEIELKDCRRYLAELRGVVAKKGAKQSKKGSPAARSDAGRAETNGAATQPPKTLLAVQSGRYQPKDRSDALSMLLSAGQFLQRHEPISPLPRLLFRLVQWARGDSLRPWLDDMFRSSDNEQERVSMQLALDAETKLANERLPSGCPAPKDRADALAMLGDVAASLHEHEPLSPLPYHLLEILALANKGSPQRWLTSIFTAESPTLARIQRLLGFTSEPAAESVATEN